MGDSDIAKKAHYMFRCGEAGKHACRAKGGKANLDMVITSRAAAKNAHTNELIWADMPSADAFRRPLLFEPYSKFYEEAGTGTGQRQDGEEKEGISPVGNKEYYHSMMTVMRNMWMVYAINTIAAKETKNNQKYLIVIGGRHAAGVGQYTGEWNSFLSKYSMRAMLKSRKVVLPFVFEKKRGKTIVRFNFDVNGLSKDDLTTMGKFRIGFGAMSEYDNWMNDEYEFGYDDEDYFDDDADYDYYYDLLNYILSLFQ